MSKFCTKNRNPRMKFKETLKKGILTSISKRYNPSCLQTNIQNINSECRDEDVELKNKESELESSVYEDHEAEIEKLFPRDLDRSNNNNITAKCDHELPAVYGDHESEIEKLFEQLRDQNDKNTISECNASAECNHSEVFDIYIDHEAEIDRLFLCAEENLAQNNLQLIEDESQEIDVENNTHSPSLLEGYECSDSDSDYTPSEHDQSQDSDDDLNEGRKRRRVADPSKWKRQVAKNLRMQGKEYTGYLRVGNKVLHNQQRAARKMGPKCDLRMCSKTKKRQCILLMDQDRKKIFKKFWSNLDWKQRKIYVINHVQRSAPLRRYTKHGNSKREETLFYYLTVGNKKMQVCKKTFLSTLAIGEFTVRSWVSKGQHGMIEINKIKENPNKNDKRELIGEFLDRLPKLPSHYGRKDCSKLYLQTDIKTITQLYKIYEEFCNDCQKSVLCASRKLFDQVIKSKNISIFTLKKDKCDTCEGYRNGNVEETTYNLHIINKEQARKQKEEDKEKALKNECTVLTMDLEAVKVAPFLHCSGYYYKTKLCCHNFTIYNLSTHHARCYWFTECDSDLSASTYTSCVIDYLKECCGDEHRKIIIYSDGCTAQNRNVTMANALLDYAIKNNIEIEQKYLVVGHTQMECDSVHACIERKLKNCEIHIPSEYAKITKEARSKPFPYDVKILDYAFFKNYAYQDLQRYASIRSGRKKGDPCVTDIKILKYNPNGKILVKINYEDDFIDLPRRPKKLPLQDWPEMYSNKLNIPVSKWKHLQELKFALPRDVHDFYDQLPYSD